MSDLDIQFLHRRHRTLVDLLKDEIVERTDNQISGNISFVDHLRFIHCLILDEKKLLYMTSQNTMLSSELDARNSSTRNPTFHEKMVMVFNDDLFEPESIFYADLHVDFVDIISLKLSNYRLTVEKSKEMLSSVKPMMVDLITRYELSGMGSGNRDTTASDWGSFDISFCENGDDRKNFLRKPTHSYLLYWWILLEREGLLNFTCVKLPFENTANTSNFPLVSDSRSPKKNSSITI